MALALDLEPLIVVHELDGGAVYAHPLANAALVSRTRSVEDALEAQRRFLRTYLARVPAPVLGEFVFPADASLLEVKVVIPRADLPARIRITSPITIPCVVVPDGADAWVHVPGLDHVVFVGEGEDVAPRVRTEIAKTARAREVVAAEYRSLWPARRIHVTRCPVRVHREDLGDLGKRAAVRRKRAKAKRTEAARKILDGIGQDWTDPKRPPGPPVMERDALVRSLGALLGGDERLAVALVGPEMAGRSAVLRALCTTGRAALQERRVIATSGAQLVAGQSGFGQLQERIEEVMRAAEQVDAIVYFDNLGDLFAGHAGSIEDLAAIMRPYLAEHRVRVVGEISPEQWEHHEKRHVGFFAVLHRVVVEPLSPEATRSLLAARVAHERRTEPERPTLADDAIAPLVELAERYLSYEAFPGKAIAFYEELRAVGEGEVTPDGTPRPIAATDVYGGFATRSGIPVFLLRDDRAMKASEVEAFFGRAIIGQRRSIRSLAETLCMVKAGLAPPAKPLSNVLFAGPTGVGKTEVAKTLARFLFGSVERLVRFDMSEYMDPLAAQRLIHGSASGDGELTRRVRQQPFCVILLDEIEKAHSAVFDLLLQVCGEGRLSDARGKTTYFHNAIIIMTSNLGATHRKPGTGFGSREDAGAATDEAHYLDQVDRHFRPEFVNRLDRVIPFSSLSRDEIAKVAEVTLRRIAGRDGFAHRGATLHVAPPVLARLAQAGYSDRYGARALRRHLEDALVTPVASGVAELGRDLDGALVEVDDPLAPERDRGEDSGAHLCTMDIAGLRIRVFRPPPRMAKAATSDLAFIASLRRDAHRCANTGPLEQMRERLDYVIADMAGADPDKAAPRGQAMAALAAEHARLSSTLERIDEAVAGVENAEDLAMAAVEEGEGAALLREEAEAAFERFERAYVRGILDTVGHDELSFIVRSPEHPRNVGAWLLPFLEGAQARSWTVTLHRHGDDEPGDGPWPSGMAWGPPRRADGSIGRLRKAKDAELTRHFRAVLVCVQGVLAGALLRRELGLVRWAGQGAEPPQHVEIIGVSDDGRPTTTDLQTDAFSLPERVKPEEARRLPALRVWWTDGSLFVDDRYRFEVGDDFDYWRDLERVQFPGIAAAALAGHDFDADD